MATLRRLGILCLAGLCATLILGCGDDGDDGDDGDVPPTPTIGGSATTGGPTVTPPPLSNANQFLYRVGAGDTLVGIADAFDGAAGKNTSLSDADLATLNQTQPSKVTAGMRILVPLVLSGPEAMFAETSIEEALGIGGAAGDLVLLQPSDEMRSGYLGLVALRSVELGDGNPEAEGFGYRMEYYRTDRPAIRAGVLDPKARFDELLFTVAGGSLAGELLAGDGEELYRFEKDGVPYAVAATDDAELSGEQIAGMLTTATER